MDARDILDCMKPLPAEDLKQVLKQTQASWEQARGRRIFISGGTGFFGTWLLETLAYCNRELDLGLSVTILTRRPNAFRQRVPALAAEPFFHLLQGDVRDFAFPETNFDYILHGAAPTTMDATTSPQELISTLVNGTQRVAELAKMRSPMSFLNVSSGAVYGRQPQDLSHLPESYVGGPDWLDPKTVYGEGKRVSEQICSVLAQESSMRVSIARCFTFVGPHLPLDQHFAIGNFIADAIAGRNIALTGDGSPTRSYLYMADLAIWLWTLLLSEKRPSENPLVLNVGSDQAITIRELAQEVIDELNPRLRVEVAIQPKLGEQRPQYVPDIRKAGTQLGLRPIVGLREAIRRTADWYR
jgi:nucleoside-diphosphate-sugar epimerase